MRICKIYDGDYPWDIRVEKIVSSLVEWGHEVHLVCRNLHKKTPDEQLDGIYIHRLPVFKSEMLNYFLSFPVFFNPVWIKRIFGIIKEYQTDLIIVRDLPMALTAVLAARFYKIPVIFDMAENYPEMLRHIWKHGKFKPLNLFVRNPLLAKIVEKIVIKYVDDIIVVIEEAKGRLKSLGVQEERIHILPNTPKLSHIYKTSQKLFHEQQSLNNSDFTVIYIGGIDPGRGLDQVIYAVPEILKEIPCFRLLIIGNRGGMVDDLKYLVDQLGLKDHVIFEGWIDPKEVPTYINLADVGIVPHCISPHTLTTIPNKLFDYMALGKPVIASNVGPIRRIIEEEKSGLVFNNQDDLIKAVVKLFSNRELRERMGANGRNAVLNKYNWECNANILRNVVQAVS